MTKAITLLTGTDGKKKLNEGDLAFTIQINRVPEKDGGYKLDANIDWSFDDEVTPEEIASGLGQILANLEEIFGERLVTKIIHNYAEDTHKIASIDAKNKIAYFKGRI